MTHETGRARTRIGCAVLAAGRSQRLGQPKQLVRLGDVPLVRQIAQVVLASDFEARAVVVGYCASDVQSALAGLEVSVLMNTAWEEGVASSIREAARWAEEQQLHGLVLTSCDQWRLSVAHLTQLRAAYQETEDLVGSAYAGAIGVPALFGRAWFARLQALSGDRGAGALLRASERTRCIAWPDGADDLDTAADLSKARASVRYARA
jgi:CTP:molybdopterin cytidylyltransferase MocA